MLSSHLNKGNMCFLPISNKPFTCIPSWGIVDSENDMFKESQGCWGPQSDIYTRCRFINLAPTLSALSWLQNKRDKTLHLKYLPIFDNLFKRKHTYILPHPTGNTPGHLDLSIQVSRFDKHPEYPLRPRVQSSLVLQSVECSHAAFPLIFSNPHQSILEFLLRLRNGL